MAFSLIFRERRKALPAQTGGTVESEQIKTSGRQLRSSIAAREPLECSAAVFLFFFTAVKIAVLRAHFKREKIEHEEGFSDLLCSRQACSFAQSELTFHGGGLFPVAHVSLHPSRSVLVFTRNTEVLVHTVLVKTRSRNEMQQ